MIKTVFFDLDWTIYSADQVFNLFAPILEVIENSSASEEFKDRYRKALRGLADFRSLDELTEDELSRIFKTYTNLEVREDIKTYGDENCIKELSTTNFLVTTGFRKFQNSKIDKLGIRELFEGIYIDEIDSTSHSDGKEHIFREIIEKYTLLPHEVLVVGDKGHSELAAGKNLGFKTAQILRPGIEKWDEADNHIHSLCEVKGLL